MGTRGSTAGWTWAKGVFCLTGTPYVLATMAFHEPLSVSSCVFIMTTLALLNGLMVACLSKRDQRPDSIRRLVWSIPAGIVAAFGYAYILPGGDSKAFFFTSGLAIGTTVWYFRKALGPRPVKFSR